MTVSPRQAAEHFFEAIRMSWSGMWRDDVAVYAAGISFHSLAGIFAGLFLFSTILEKLGVDRDFLPTASRFLEGAIPPEALEIVGTALEVLDQPVPAALLPLAVLITFWVTSNVFQTVIHALNKIYHLGETRSPWITRMFALAVVFIVGLSLAAAFLLLTLGGVFGSTPEAWQDAQGGFLNFLFRAHNLLAAIPVLLGSLLLYWLGPNFRAGHRVVLPGAAWFTVTWMGASYIFNLYLRHFAVYDRVYGPLATVVVFLTFVYLSALLLLIGGEINASYGLILTRKTTDQSPARS